jgi:hypothetical protein
MTTYNINENHSPSNRPNYQLGISKPTAKIPNYSSLDILRPENYDKYFISEPIDFNIANTIYRGLENCFVLSKGSGYTISSTLTLDSPDDINGTQAQGEICFGLTDQSINIDNPGSGYKVNDIISILNDDPASLATVFVDSVDNNGSITSLFIIDAGCFTNNHPSIVEDNNGSAVLTFNTNQYNINYINITEPGNGYLFMDSSGYIIDHQSSISGSGSGFMAYISMYEDIYDYQRYINTEDNIIGSRKSNITKTKYGTEILNINFS